MAKSNKPNKIKNLLKRWLVLAGGGAGTWYAVLYFWSGGSTTWGPFASRDTVSLVVASFATALAILGFCSWKFMQKPAGGASINSDGRASRTGWKK